jgi:acyl dehydratase
MALPLEKLGTTAEPRTAIIEPERAKAYAAATNDHNPAYESGKYAPPVFAVVPTWDSMVEVTGQVVPPEALLMVVHGEQDMHFHQPLVPGQTIVTRAEAHSVRVGNSGTRFTVRVWSDDQDGAPVMEMYVTSFIRGMTDGESGGPEKPGHAFSEEARSQSVGEVTLQVDADQTYRYADASGDRMPIHLDEGVAKSVGLPGIIVHGLCTMAVCSQAVVKTVADGDPSRLKRLAVRFSKPVFPGREVTVAIYDAGQEGGRRAYAFEATSGGDTVIKDGRAEVEA